MNLRIKKTAKSLVEFTAIVLLMLLSIKVSSLVAFAGSALPLVQDEFVGNVPTPPEGKTGQEIVVDVVFAGLGYVKAITAVVGILYITLQGVRLVTAGGDEETITKAKRGIIYILISLVLISMSQDLGRIFDMKNSALLSSPQDILNRIHIFDKEVEIFITFAKYILGAYATLMIIISGFRLITSGGNEEKVGEERKRIMYGIGGLLMIYLGDIGLQKVFYKVNKEVYSGVTGVTPGVDAAEGVNQIVGITNLIVSIVGPAAVLMLIVGAIMYATAGGKEESMEKAKRVVMVAIVGIVIIFGAFALVSTVVAGRLSDAGALLN